jgi:hypothetical protein
MDEILLMSETDKTPRIVIPFRAHPAPIPKTPNLRRARSSLPNLSSLLPHSSALKPKILSPHCAPRPFPKIQNPDINQYIQIFVQLQRPDRRWFTRWYASCEERIAIMALASRLNEG